MKKLLIGATLVLGACGLSQDKFEEEFGAKYCEANNACLEAAELEPIDCDAAVDGGDDVAEVECEYDAGAAKECLDAIDTAECDELGFLPLPSVCADVCPVAAAE
jgi:hypothetical protein